MGSYSDFIKAYPVIEPSFTFSQPQHNICIGCNSYHVVIQIYKERMMVSSDYHRPTPCSIDPYIRR